MQGIPNGLIYLAANQKGGGQKPETPDEFTQFLVCLFGAAIIALIAVYACLFYLIPKEDETKPKEPVPVIQEKFAGKTVKNISRNIKQDGELFIEFTDGSVMFVEASKYNLKISEKGN
jgi:hypothetical protein